MEEEENFPVKETSCIIKSNKECEYKITFSVCKNDNISIKISTINVIPTKKFALVCSLEELVKNRFFKIFVNVDEIFRELETKIQNSLIIEESNAIYLDIPIGLNVINDIILKVKQTERNKDEIIEDQKNEINQLKKENNQLKINLNEKEKEKEIISKENLEKKLNEKQKELNEIKEINEIYDLVFGDYENIIEIEINSNNNGKSKIINDKIFDKNQTILFLNNKLIDFKNKIKLEKNNNKILLFNNNKLESLEKMYQECDITKIKFIKFNTENVKNIEFYVC